MTAVELRMSCRRRRCRICERSLTSGQIADLAKEDLGEIQLAPDESSIFKWKAILPGPAGSPYEGGRFQVDITVPPEYP